MARAIDNRAFGALENAVKNLTDNWLEQDRKANEGRKELHQAVNELRIEIATLQQKVEPIAVMDQRIDKLEAARNRAIGAVWGARAVIAALGGAIGALLTKFGLK